MLITTDEAARRLRVSRTTMKQLLYEGAVPHVRIRRCVRIRADAIDEYIAERERSTMNDGERSETT